MKIKLLFLFVYLLGTISLYAQVNYRVSTLSEAIQTADSITKLSKRSFKFKSAEILKDSIVLMIDHICQSDSSINLYVFFNKLMVGANAALEIEGTPEYKFSSAIGRYLDLFPFWKKHIDPDADIEKCIKAFNSKTVDNYKFWFRKVDNLWEIRMH